MIFEIEQKADFIYQNFYEDEEFNKTRIYTGINIITPKKGYWDYILNKYSNSQLDEEEVLFLEQFISLNIAEIDKKFFGKYYHDTRKIKYWIRENLTNSSDVKEYALRLICSLTNKIDLDNIYVSICYNSSYLPSMLLLNN